MDDDDDEADETENEQALALFRRLVEAVGGDIDEPDDDAGPLSFQIAARVDFGTEPKQELLELRSEPARLRHLFPLLEAAIEAVQREREVRERAATNGKVSQG